MASAKADYRKAIELDETLEEAYVGLADVYVRQGDLDKAKEILQLGVNHAGSSKKIEEKLKELDRAQRTDQPDQSDRPGQTDRLTHENQRIEDIRFARFEEQNMEYAVITGVNSAGETQWTYTTIKSGMTELTQMEEIGLVNGLYYFNEVGTVVVLDPESGEVVWKNGEFGGCSISYDFSKSGDLFLSGYYGLDFFWVDANGKTVRRVERIDTRYFWPDKIRCWDGYVEITMRGDLDGYGEHIITVSLEDAAGAEDLAWRQAYRQRLIEEDGIGHYDEFQLIYVDDDQIPELWMNGFGPQLWTFNGQQVNMMYISSYGDLKYLDRGGLFYTSSGRMGGYSDDVYSLRNGEFMLIAQGSYGAEDNINVQYDENGSPIYRYYWGGGEVTEEGYQNELDRIFDPTRVRDVFSGTSYNSTELMELLSQ